MKKCVYTVIVNGYDSLKEPLIKSEGWDHICFTDKMFKHDSKIWKLRVFDKGKLDKYKASRFPKINPHKFVQDYDYSVYIDGSMRILRDLNSFCEGLKWPSFAIPRHYREKCLFNEIFMCIKKRKADANLLRSQLYQYRRDKMPFNFGLYACGLMLRNHNEIENINICERWWDEIMKYSHRDQIPLSYVLWKLDKKITPFNWRRFLDYNENGPNRRSGIFFLVGEHGYRCGA